MKGSANDGSAARVVAEPGSAAWQPLIAATG
jgi:hypothetical protein